jgi:hypothetical protein
MPAINLRRRLMTGLFGGLLTVAVMALGVHHLGAELWTALSGPTEASDVAVAANQSLPVDAPAMTRLRCQQHESSASKAAQSTEGVVLLDDWTYTQSGSPFFFAPNGFDFFNPLFAFNFASPQTIQPTVMTTPFGFMTTGSTPTSTTSTGNGGFVFTLPGTGGSTTSTSSFGPMGSFSNGSDPPVGGSSSATVVAFPTVFPLALGRFGFSHRHGFAPIIVVVNLNITINVNVNVNVVISPSR